MIRVARMEDGPTTTQGGIGLGVIVAGARRGSLD